MQARRCAREMNMDTSPVVTHSALHTNTAAVLLDNGSEVTWTITGVKEWPCNLQNKWSQDSEDASVSLNVNICMVHSFFFKQISDNYIFLLLNLQRNVEDNVYLSCSQTQCLLCSIVWLWLGFEIHLILYNIFCFCNLYRSFKAIQRWMNL